MTKGNTTPLKLSREAVLSRVSQLYPNILRQAEEDLKNLLPGVVLGDVEEIPAIFDHYCSLLDLNPQEAAASIRHRKMFYALLLHLFHPEKLYRLTQSKVRPGLGLFAAKAANCDPEIFRHYTQEVIVHFHSYSDMRAEVIRLHGLILEKFTPKP